MKFYHVSDTHGYFPQLIGDYDAVIHSGDFLPTSIEYWHGSRTKGEEAAFQLQWLISRALTIKEWIKGKPFLFTLGNHDFLHPEFVETRLQEVGIEAVCLHDKISFFEGVSFYGFPYVPTIGGMWHYELDIPEMQKEADKMFAKISDSYIDVIVAHSPIYKTLDLTHYNENIGSTVLANLFDYKLDKDRLPSYFLCGHCHESNGLTNRNGMIISNAATTQRIIDIL